MFSKRFGPGILSWMMILSWMLTGCADKAIIVKSMEPIMDDFNISVNRNPDVDTVRDAMPASLIQLDGFITAAPNSKLLLRAAEGYFGYSFAFVESQNKERASYLYLKARDYALRALTGSNAHLQFIQKPVEEFIPSLDDFDKNDVPALYWSANCWMAWAALN
ncbi:hypothetical protein EG833_03695, partial [archaeon]|nr:hypothetical protein [archaeon]